MKKLTLWMFILLTSIGYSDFIPLRQDTNAHIVAGAGICKGLELAGVTGNNRFLVASAAFVGKELVDNDFEALDILADYMGCFLTLRIEF